MFEPINNHFDRRLRTSIHVFYWFDLLLAAGTLYLLLTMDLSPFEFYIAVGIMARFALSTSTYVQFFLKPCSCTCCQGLSPTSTYFLVPSGDGEVIEMEVVDDEEAQVPRSQIKFSRWVNDPCTHSDQYYH